MMVSFPRLITALLIKSLVVGGRADLIFLSLFLYSSFTTPSGLHRQKKNRLLLCGSCFNQLPDYSNKVGFISFAGLKLFPLLDKFISSASGFQPAKNVSNLKTTASWSWQKDTWGEVTSELKWSQSNQCADGTFTCDTCVMDNPTLKACDWRVFTAGTVFLKWWFKIWRFLINIGLRRGKTGVVYSQYILQR